jgi:hypothetical protein
MSIVQPIVSSVVKSIIKSITGLISRYFLTFDSSLNSYCELSTLFQPSGNFKAKIDFSTTSNDAQTLFGGELAGTDEIKLEINTSGYVVASAYVGTSLQTAITGSLALDDGKLHSAEIVYTGTTVELFVNEFSSGTQTWSLNGSQTIKYVGRLSTGAYFDGVLANPVLTDLETPANSQAYRLDQSTGTTESSLVNTGTLTYNNIPESSREIYELLNGQWNNLFYPNLLTYSEEFGNAVWNKSGSHTITSNAIAAPDGSITADLINDTDTSGNSFYINQTLSTPDDSLERTFSIYLKEGTALETELKLIYIGNSNTLASAIINWSSHTVNNGTIESVGNGWYRISVSHANNLSGNESVVSRLYPATDESDLTGSVYVWGGQLEEGPVATAYKKTTNVASKSLVVPTPPAPLFNSSGVLTCSGTLSCSEIIPCGV